MCERVCYKGNDMITGMFSFACASQGEVPDKTPMFVFWLSNVLHLLDCMKLYSAEEQFADGRPLPVSTPNSVTHVTTCSPRFTAWPLISRVSC